MNRLQTWKYAAIISALFLVALFSTNTAAEAFTIQPLSPSALIKISPSSHSSVWSIISDLLPYSFAFTESPLQVTTQAPTAASTTVNDIVYSDSNTGVFQNICSLSVSGGFSSPVFSSANPSIATVDPSSGIVSYVSNGTALLNATINGFTKQIACPVNQVNNIFTRVFYGLNPSSMGWTLDQAVRPLISGKSPGSSQNVYSSVDDVNHIYVRNPNLFTAGAYDPTPFPALVDGGTTGSGVLIAQDMLVTACHVFGSNPVNGGMGCLNVTGSKFYFVDMNNNTFVATVSTSTVVVDRGMTGDLLLVKFSNPLPASIHPALVYSTSTQSTSDYISCPAQKLSVIPILSNNQFRTISVGAVAYATPPVYFVVGIGIPNSSTPYVPWFIYPRGGDSGTAMFEILPSTTTPVALGTYESAGYNGGAGMSIGGYYSDIVADMAIMGSPYSLNTVDLSGFPKYSCY